MSRTITQKIVKPPENRRLQTEDKVAVLLNKKAVRQLLFLVEKSRGKC